MSKLHGGQRMVLQAVNDLPKNAAGFVTDDQVADSTRIALNDVRDWFETLGEDGFVELARTTAGLSASINAKGRLQIGSYEPIPTTQSGTSGNVSAGPQPRSTDPQAKPSLSRTPANPSAEELASLLDARLPGVLSVVGAEQTNRRTPQKEAQDFISQLKNFHANIVENLRANRIVAAYELIGDFKETVARFLNDPLNKVVTRFRYADTPERGQDPEYDSLVDERLSNYERAEDLYPGGEVAKLIKQQEGDGTEQGSGPVFLGHSSIQL